MSTTISSRELRELYGYPRDFVVNAHAPCLEEATTRFIAASPFVIISSINSEGHVDISPKGGEPGFVNVVSKSQLRFLDQPGNKKLHTIENIIKNNRIGMMFMIPGIGDFLRLYGEAKAFHDERVITDLGGDAIHNKLVIEVEIKKVFPHCPKAANKGKIWDRTLADNGEVPNVAEMAELLADSRH